MTEINFLFIYSSKALLYVKIILKNLRTTMLLEVYRPKPPFQHHHGKKNEHEEGHHHRNQKGHKFNEGHDSHHRREKKYGKKGGHESGKKWFASNGH